AGNANNRIETDTATVAVTEPTTPTVTDTPTPVPGSPSVNVLGGFVDTGESITVEVTAEDVGTLSLAGIPTGWGVEASTAAGASPLVNVSNGAQKVAWVWSENQDSISATVTLSIPNDAASGETMVTAEASNNKNLHATQTASIMVSDPSVTMTPETATPTETTETPTETPTTTPPGAVESSISIETTKTATG
ncbi:MAG: hypothetical protein ABEJ86_02290, partial [Halococcoides sp.]